jgi:membrane associated rhomboid family serine protease
VLNPQKGATLSVSEAALQSLFETMMSADDVVYRVDNVAAYYEDDSSDDEEMIIDSQQQQVPDMKRPPPISTGGFDASFLDEEEGEEVVISDLHERHVHFQDPKRSSYPVQSLRTTALEHEKDNSNNNTNMVDATPAFLRRAARDMNANANTARVINPQPPNTLSMLRDNNNNNNANDYSNTMPDSSFYGADASALDGTFVSIRDLNDDDDVPSIDNDWNNSTFDRHSDVSSGFPTETTSLLQQHQQQQLQQRNRKNQKQLPWQGGFFGSQVEKEDRRERRKMIQKRGWFHGVISKKNEMMNHHHPTGDDFIPRRQNNNNYSHKPYYQPPRSPLSFSTFLTCALCFHIGLCGIHDLFMRYLSYRNPDNSTAEAETSWNGEGTYIPAYWFSVEGRINNPLIGPGARTLTAFGALVPGIVLSKGQRWRILTALFETSSCIQLALQLWLLKTVVGSSMIGLERTRGTFSVALLYLVSALIGSVWSMALEPGRLITASEMGTAGLLAGAMMQQLFTSDSNKDDDDSDSNAAVDFGSHRSQHVNGNGSNVMATASNEQFTFRPVVPKKKRRVQFNIHSPFLMMVFQIILSWLSAYSSLIGTIAAAGASCALLLLFGATRNSPSQSAYNDLSFSESVPPPPPPPTRFDDEGWNDDESTDTSVGHGKQVFHTPLMRRSILADDDDEEEPLGSRSSLRKRKGDVASSSATPRGLNGHLVRGKPINAYQVLSRLIGILMATILTLIPVVLIASSGGISNELTRAAVLGCKPMRIVYQGDSGSEESFECAGGCVPLSLVRVAQRKESMKAGRCDSIAYRCWQQAGTMTLRNYEVDVGIYVVPTADGICSNEVDSDENNYDADGSEAAADNENDVESQEDVEQ